MLVSIDATHQTQKTVLDHISKKPRRELKIGCIAEYFSLNFKVFGMWSDMVLGV